MQIASRHKFRSVFLVSLYETGLALDAYAWGSAHGADTSNILKIVRGAWTNMSLFFWYLWTYQTTFGLYLFLWSFTAIFTIYEVDERDEAGRIR